jgi:hypothetical protein
MGTKLWSFCFAPNGASTFWCFYATKLLLQRSISLQYYNIKDMAHGSSQREREMLREHNKYE